MITPPRVVAQPISAGNIGRVRCLLLPCALLAACAPAPPERPAARADAIVGGVELLDGGFDAVFMIHTNYDNGTRSACSATLITPRTLLTAAHCVDPRKAGATSGQTFFQNLPVAPPRDGGTWAPAAEARFHPQYVPNNLFDYDVAVVLLPAPSAVTPLPYNRQSVAGLTGQPLTALGYGITQEGALDFGTRRAVDLTFRAVSATHIALGDQAQKGICDGDSGGPSLHRFPDGVTRVVGVHNYKQPAGACHDGLDTRVDLFSSFLQQWIAEKEGPTCVEDGLCKPSGCALADPDCAAPDAGAADAGAPPTDGGAAGTPQELGPAGCAAAPAPPLWLLALALGRCFRRAPRPRAAPARA